ncbi:uncharacterized protein TNCV_3059921 [Trichonephila clavipes]|nr:uncharacterized protein TNCV_3059921 [Trichonephila clavipes]
MIMCAQNDNVCSKNIFDADSDNENEMNNAAPLCSHVIRNEEQGCGSPVVKVSDHDRHVMSSSPVPLKTRRVGQRCTLNLPRAETSSQWCGVVVREGGASSSAVHVTRPWFKITWSVAKSPRVAEQCDVNIHSPEMKNIMKCMRSYLDAHSTGEMNNKINDIEQFVDNIVLKKKIHIYMWHAAKTKQSSRAGASNSQVIYSQFGLAIHQNDHQARRRFVEWAQNEIAAVPDFHKRILFSDEAHFWLNGYVNKQNCRICSEANLQVYVETPLHPEKLTVWCALWVGGIIGPYFFKNDEGHNVTVNGDRYRAMITNLFIPELNNHDVQELWFQQDGTTCHTARATIHLLKDTFGDHLISRFGPVNWPPRSCDLTPLDYFLWGYVKSLVYADRPQTLDHLEDNIRRVIADIRPQMLEKVIEN